MKVIGSEASVTCLCQTSLLGVNCSLLLDRNVIDTPQDWSEKLCTDLCVTFGYILFIHYIQILTNLKKNAGTCVFAAFVPFCVCRALGSSGSCMYGMYNNTVVLLRPEKSKQYTV